MSAESIREATEKAEQRKLSLDELVQELARLSPLEYEQKKKPIAKAYGINRISVLDKEVEKARKDTDDDTAKGRKIEYTDTEPWPEPVNGVAVLDEAANLIMKHMVIREVDAYACALWAVHTHIFKLFSHIPRLLIDAPDAECGKTLLMTHMVGNLVNRSQHVELMKPAPFFRLAQDFQPTFLIDEMDVFIKEDTDLLAAVNGGWEPQGGVPRCVGDDHEVRVFSTYCPTAMAGIALSRKLPNTTVSRSVVIHLERASEDEMQRHVVYDSRKHKQALLDVNRKIARWCQDNINQLSKCEPELPETMRNRLADKWRSLFVISEVAGGHWPKRIRDTVTNRYDAKEPSRELELLIDIQEAFRSDEQLHTATLIDRLCDPENSRWADYNFKNIDADRRRINPRQMANLLKTYGIKSAQTWFNSSNKQGYSKQDFLKPWERYLPKKAQLRDKGGDTPKSNPRTLDTNNGAGFSEFYTLEGEIDPRVKNSPKPNTHASPRVLGDRKGGTGGEGNSEGKKHDFEAGLESVEL